MNYDSITIDPVSPDWTWAIWVAIVSAVLIVAAVLIYRNRGAFIDRGKGTPAYMVGCSCVILGFFGLLFAAITPPTLTMNVVTEHQELALQRQLRLVSVEVAGSSFFGSRTFIGETFEGTYIKGKLEAYKENVYIIVLDESTQ